MFFNDRLDKKILLSPKFSADLLFVVIDHVYSQNLLFISLSVFLLFYIFQKNLLLIIGGTKRFAFILITGARARADPRVYAYACSAKTFSVIFHIVRILG